MGSLNGWTFCPRCRARLEPGPRRVECPDCGFVAYANPSPTACAVCVDEDEHPLDAIRRELHEETGLEVEPLDFVGVWMDRYSEDESGESTLNLYWRARVVGGEPRAADDVSELRWFAPSELPPPDEIAFRNVREVLARFRDEDA